MNINTNEQTWKAYRVMVAGKKAVITISPAAALAAGVTQDELVPVATNGAARIPDNACVRFGLGRNEQIVSIYGDRIDDMYSFGTREEMTARGIDCQTLDSQAPVTLDELLKPATGK